MALQHLKDYVKNYHDAMMKPRRKPTRRVTGTASAPDRRKTEPKSGSLNERGWARLDAMAAATRPVNSSAPLRECNAPVVMRPADSKKDDESWLIATNILYRITTHGDGFYAEFGESVEEGACAGHDEGVVKSVVKVLYHGARVQNETVPPDDIED